MSDSENSYDIFIYEDDLDDHISYLEETYIDMGHEEYIEENVIDGIILTDECKWDDNGDVYDQIYGKKYFNTIEQIGCHSNVPSSGVNVYSFSLHPEEYKPSGFGGGWSRIDDVKLDLTFYDDIKEHNGAQTQFKPKGLCLPCSA